MPSPVTKERFDAVLFDLDGVLTTTRTVHAAAWKRTFDEYLSAWDAAHGTGTPRFDERTDYASYVDGKPRQEGVRDFLASRGITLAEGAPDSPPEEESLWGLGNRKQLLVETELERTGVEVFPGSVAWVRELREAGLKTGVVSSSRNCAAVLAYAGITNLFDTRWMETPRSSSGCRGNRRRTPSWREPGASMSRPSARWSWRTHLRACRQGAPAGSE
jgi:alpha,alpha-trehalose phosphorylase